MYDIGPIGNQFHVPDSENTAFTDQAPGGPDGTTSNSAYRGRAATPQEYARMAKDSSPAELLKMPREVVDKLLPYLDPAQVAEIFPALVNSKGQLALLRPAQLALLSPAQIARIFPLLSPEQIAALKSAQMAAVPAEQLERVLSGWTAAQIRKIAHILSVSQIVPLLTTPASRIISGLTTHHIGGVLPLLESEQLANLFSGMEPNRMREMVPLLPPGVLAKLNAATQMLVMSYLKPEQVSQIWSELSDESVRLLRADQLSALKAGQLSMGFERLSTAQFAGLSPAQLAQLTPAQAAFVTSALLRTAAARGEIRQHSALAMEQAKRAMGPSKDDETESAAEEEPGDSTEGQDTAKRSFAHRPAPVARIIKVANLSPLEVKQMFAQLSREQWRDLKPEQLAYLSGDEILRVLSKLSPKEIDNTLSQLSKAQLESIPWAAHAAWIAYLPPGRTADVLSQLGNEGVQKLSDAQLSALSAKDMAQIFGRMSRSQSHALRPEQLTEISTEQLEQLLLESSPARLAVLVSSLPATQLMRQRWGRKMGWLSYVTPDQAAWLLPHLSGPEVKALRPITLTSLTAMEVSRWFSKFSLEQLTHLRPAQLASLSMAHKKQIGEYSDKKARTEPRDDRSTADAGQGPQIRDLV
jgi:hypothetical protein